VRGEELEEAGFLKLNVFWKGLAAVGLQLVPLQVPRPWDETWSKGGSKRGGECEEN